jgi:TetR/AcrR family transcriptional regulator, fatty acid biosynthesis regulator
LDVFFGSKGVYCKKQDIFSIGFSLTKPTKPRRTRLSPQERSQLILDVAAQIVTNEGVSAVNMDRLGRDAGISKALVYNYYPNRNDLLRALLLRELGIYNEQQRLGAEAARDMESLIRITTRTYLDHISDKGVLIDRLMNEPSIAEAMGDMERQARAHTVEYLATRLRAGKTMSAQVARMMVELGLGLTGAGGAYLDRTACDIDLLEDMLVTMIKANLDAVEANYATWRNVGKLA